jgi:hypothetical protein
LVKSKGCKVAVNRIKEQEVEVEGELTSGDFEQEEGAHESKR